MSFFDTRIQIGTPSGSVPPADFDPQDVDLRLSWSCGRTDLRSAEYASTLVFSIPWRARGVDPDFPVGSTVYLTLGAIIGGTVVLHLEHTVTEVVVDSDVLKITATSPEWRILDGDTATVPPEPDGQQQLEQVVSSQTGTTIALHPDTWGGGNITTTSLPVGEMFTKAVANTLHGRIKKGYQPGGLFPPARLSFTNSELSGIGRTPIDILPEWIIRSPQSVRAAVNSPDTITVAGYSATVTRSTGLGTNISTTVTTQLDATSDLDAIADSLEDAWTDLPGKPWKGWLPRAVTILLDKVYDDTGEDLWVEIVGASLVHLDDATPIRTVNVPVIPPSTPSGSWTFLPCYVEGVQLQRTPEGSTARLYCVPETLLRREDVLDIATDPADVWGWWDAMLPSTITATGTAVEQWRSRVGSHVLEQTDGTRKPTLSTLAGRVALDFDGTSDRMIETGVTLTQPFTIATVIDPGTLASGDDVVEGGTGDVRLGFNSTPKTYMYAGANLIAATSTGLTSAQVLIGVFNGASSSLWRDGVLIASGNAGTNGITVDDFAVGYRTTRRYDGKVGEVIVVEEALDTDQIAALSRSLEQKWGLT